MRPPWGWSLPQGKSTPARACRAGRRPRPEPDRQTPRWAWARVDRLLAVPRWKRVILMHVVPVCMAMLWQLGVVIGFLVLFLSGLTLIKLL